jgi:hypothetical protein
VDLAKLLQQLEAALDPTTVLQPYVELLSSAGRQRLIESDIDHAERFPTEETELGEYPTRVPVLQLISRAAKQRLIKLQRLSKSHIGYAERFPAEESELVALEPDRDSQFAQVSSILRYTLWKRADGSEDAERLAQYIRREFDRALTTPATCARLMSYRAMLQAQMSALVAEVERLTCRAHPGQPPHLIHRLSNEASLDAVRARWPGRFAEQLLRDGMRVKDELDAITALHAILRVENRFPLVPTQYSIFVPSWQTQIDTVDALDEAIREVRTNAAVLQRLTPRDFERFLQRLFEGLGFDVNLTAATRDGGVDLICVSTRGGIPIKMAVEAKRYAPTRPVDVTLVRSFVGANAQWNANKLLYVTTSSYTRDAVKYTSAIQTNLLELAATPEIMRWANEYGAHRNVVWPA